MCLLCLVAMAVSSRREGVTRSSQATRVVAIRVAENSALPFKCLDCEYSTRCFTVPRCFIYRFCKKKKEIALKSSNTNLFM